MHSEAIAAYLYLMPTSFCLLDPVPLKEIIMQDIFDQIIFSPNLTKCLDFFTVYSLN